MPMLRYFNEHPGVNVQLVSHLDTGALVPLLSAVLRLPCLPTDALQSLKLAHRDEYTLVDILLRSVAGDTTLTRAAECTRNEAASNAADVLVALCSEWSLMCRAFAAWLNFTT